MVYTKILNPNWTLNNNHKTKKNGIKMTEYLSATIIISLITLTSFSYDIETTFNLGNKTCKLSVVGQDHKFGKFISLHDNENTSVDAFLDIKSSLPRCRLYELKQKNERLLKYEINGNIYSFDPNRIFSLNGIKGTLSKYNKNYPIKLEKLINSFAESLLDAMKLTNANNYIVAIHNNTNNDFSVLSYLNSKDAKEVYLNDAEDIDNFFYVISKTDFDYFKSKKYNVVLQSVSASDDGSLSVYCQRKKLHYINIEAQQGQKRQQEKMILETYSLIKNNLK
jgi:hypothetical protein